MRSSFLRVGALGLLAVIVAIALFLSTVPSGVGGRPHSVFSVEDDGRLGAYLLLEELGFDPKPWRRAPGHLPRGGDLLWLAEAPQAPPVYQSDLWEGIDASEDPDELGDPEDAPEDAPVDAPGEQVGELGDEPRRPLVSRRLRDPRHYRRFVEEGGTLVCGLTEELYDFLTFDLDLVEVYDVEVGDGGELADGRQVAVTRTGERVEGGWRRRRWLDVQEGTDAGFETLIADEDGRPLLMRLRVGRGSLALLPEDGFLANRSLGEADNGLLLVRIVEELRGPGQLLFDEYALGGWVPETPIELAFAPHSFGFSMHLVVLLALVLWGLAWVFPFPRDPSPLGAMSPLARAQAHGRMLEASRRYDLIASLLRAGALRRLSPQRRRGGESEDDDPTPEELRRILDPLAARAGGPEQLAVWRRALEPHPVTRRADLEHLAATLARIEKLAHGRPRPQNARSRG